MLSFYLDPIWSYGSSLIEPSEICWTRHEIWKDNINNLFSSTTKQLLPLPFFTCRNGHLSNPKLSLCIFESFSHLSHFWTENQKVYLWILKVVRGENFYIAFVLFKNILARVNIYYEEEFRSYTFVIDLSSNRDLSQH